MKQLYRKEGRRYVPVPDQLDQWTCFMATCAVRYCHGRASYAPSAAMDWCRDHWHRLTPNGRFCIVRDTIQWLSDRVLWDKDGAARMDDYRGAWSAFALDRIKAEGGDFGPRVVRAALHSDAHREGPEVRPFLKYLEGKK